MRSIFKIVLSKLIGFLVFLILLGLANIISNVVGNSAFEEIVTFLNSTIGILFILTVLFMGAEILWQFPIPINLVAPVLNAGAAYFVVTFLLKLFDMIGSLAAVNISGPFEKIAPFIYILVIVIVLISGYSRIFSRKPRDIEREIRDRKRELSERRRAERRKRTEKVARDRRNRSRRK